MSPLRQERARVTCPWCHTAHIWFGGDSPVMPAGWILITPDKATGMWFSSWRCVTGYAKTQDQT